MKYPSQLEIHAYLHCCRQMMLETVTVGEEDGTPVEVNKRRGRGPLQPQKEQQLSGRHLVSYSSSSSPTCSGCCSARPSCSSLSPSPSSSSSYSLPTLAGVSTYIKHTVTSCLRGNYLIRTFAKTNESFLAK